MSTSNHTVRLSTHLPGYGRALITPLSAPTSANSLSGRKDTIIKKILLKAVWTLRDVNISNIVSCDQLKALIKSQLYSDLVKYFEVGYYDGSTVVSIRSAEDLGEYGVI